MRASRICAAGKRSGSIMPTLNASNAAQLVSAVASAKAGDTILLAGGNYGDDNSN